MKHATALDDSATSKIRHHGCTRNLPLFDHTPFGAATSQNAASESLLDAEPQAAEQIGHRPRRLGDLDSAIISRRRSPVHHGIRRLRLAQCQVYYPAPAEVRPLAAAVGQDFLAGAPGVHEGVGQQGQPVECPVVVERSGQPDHVDRAPPRRGTARGGRGYRRHTGAGRTGPPPPRRGSGQRGSKLAQRLSAGAIPRHLPPPAWHRTLRPLMPRQCRRRPRQGNPRAPTRCRGRLCGSGHCWRKPSWRPRPRSRGRGPCWGSRGSPSTCRRG